MKNDAKNKLDKQADVHQKIKGIRYQKYKLMNVNKGSFIL